MSENKLMAEVNGKEIYTSDVYDLMAGIQDRERFNNEEGIKILADELVNQELLLIEAKDRKLEEDPEFQKELETVKDNMLKNFAMHKIFEAVEINDDEVKAYYEKNKDTLFSPVTYTASHILVADEDEAKKVADEIANGLAFEQAASKYSLDPSGTNGGSLGSFPKGVMVPEFESALDTLENGEISAPVKSQFGYHIIRLDNKDLSENSYEDIKENVKMTYEMSKRQEKYLELLNEVSNKAEVKKYY